MEVWFRQRTSAGKSSKYASATRLNFGELYTGYILESGTKAYAVQSTMRSHSGRAGEVVLWTGKRRNAAAAANNCLSLSIREH